MRWKKMGHRARRRPTRTRSIRLTLAGLLIIPLISLVALWGYAASISVGNAIAKQNYDTQNTDTGAPSQALLVQLVQERLQTFVWLSTGRLAPRAGMDAQRKRTDAAIARFRVGADAASGALSPEARQDLSASVGQLGRLSRNRSAIDGGTVPALAAFQAYNGIVDSLFQFFQVEAAVSNIPIATYQQAEGNLDGGRALELAGREAALVGGALASRGRMSPSGHELFVQTVDNQRLLEQQALSALNAQLAAPYRRLFASPTYAGFKAMENRIVAASPSAPVPVSPGAWQSGVQSFLAAFNQTAGIGRQGVTKGIAAAGNSILLQLYLVGGAGLAAVLASTFLLVRFGRRITKELTGLLGAVRTLAEERLPMLVSRLRRGDNVDAAAEAPPLDLRARTTEVAKIAQAFSAVQRTAVEAAVGQAELRRGVSQVFRSLARRSQSLLHRQLRMLDAMEDRADDADVLADLFRLDHLTTRMRRHAEGLIILSGAAPGRGWRSPVPVIEVLRGAIGEIEDYVRVDIHAESQDAVAGAAVADVIHLLAELIENAATFSPPNTRVSVRADRVGSGFAVEIEDRGLGITAAALAAINTRLANPPEFDLADSDQLGLFVVSQLAARHKIKVSLRGSPYGGTTAIVLMPHGIVVPPGRPPAGLDGPALRGPDGPALQLTADAAGGPAAAGPEVPVRSGSLALEPVGAPASPDTGTQSTTSPAGRGGPATEPLPRTRHDSNPPAGPATTGPAEAGTRPALPRRVRQANMAPQLRDTAHPSLARDAAPDHAATHRAPEPPSPDRTRALFTSLQQGWQRGRSQADQPEGPGDVPSATPDASPGPADSESES
jgi:signal transduction histidine kinase